MIDRRTIILSLGSAAAAAATLRAQGAPRRPTPFTDIGPFYPVARPAEDDNDLTLVGRRAAGQAIEVTGRLLDLKGQPIAGARIEMWQANAAGRYAHAGDQRDTPLDPAFQGFGRLVTDSRGHYRFVTILPGAYPIPGGAIRPPHLHLDVAGKSDRLITQMLFPGDPRNDSDPVLASVNRAPLTATALGQAASGARRYGWDIILANG